MEYNRPRDVSKKGELDSFSNTMEELRQDYSQIQGLRLEARQKLNQFRPASIGQASRISGVNPADVTVLLIWFDRRKDS